MEGGARDPAVYARREADWRQGAIVYQVLVDRFAPASDLAGKQHLYAPPRRLRDWHELPTGGRYLDDEGLWSHELEFWGGDLQSLRARLDHVRGLGADVLYLNPIHAAFSNHKYDASDYHAIAPEFGTLEDLDALLADAHAAGLRVVLDGVFNHMGRRAPRFLEAQADPSHAFRDWFAWLGDPPGEARGWMGARNLPELNLENPAVRAHVYEDATSVVQSYLARGVDGWRLDVAYDLGFDHLAALNAAAHRCRPDSLVVGEIANYPADWLRCLDGVVGFTMRELVLRLARGELPPATGARMIARLVADAGIEPTLRSWLMLDNHDTPRLATALPEAGPRRLAQVLQFTLPGSPNLFYGSELGREGGDDPAMRGPMPWHLATDDNAELAWVRQLVALRKAHRGLRIGDFRLLEATHLLAFERYTDRSADTIIVLVNPSGEAVEETVLVPDSRLMNMGRLLDLLDPAAEPLAIESALLRIRLPPAGVRVFGLDTAARRGYTPYKRVP
jgi:glycosidase